MTEPACPFAPDCTDPDHAMPADLTPEQVHPALPELAEAYKAGFRTGSTQHAARLPPQTPTARQALLDAAHELSQLPADDPRQPWTVLRERADTLDAPRTADSDDEPELDAHTLRALGINR